LRIIRLLLEATGEKLDDFIEQTRDVEETITRDVPVLDEKGNAILDENGDVVTTPETKTTIKTETFKASPKSQVVKSRICNTKKSSATWGFYGGIDKEGRDMVLALGTGFAFVVNTGIDIQIGDYLMSSDVTGCTEKQDDDLLHNYTVAKTLEAIVWEVAEVQRKIAVTYHCG